MVKSMTTKSDAEQKIWNTLAGISKTIAEMSQDTKDARRERLESSRERLESNRERLESNREFEKQMSEMDQEIKEARREFYSGLKAIREEYGGYTNRESIILEDEFLAALQEKKQVGNIHLDYVRVRVNNGHEYDLVGINGGATVVGEIKRHFRVKDVKEFVDKLSQNFAKDFPEYARPKIYGMVAGESITEAAAVSAKKHGLFILRLKNKALVVENSKNAKPIV